MLGRVLKALLSRQAKGQRGDPESELRLLLEERRADEALARCDALLAERSDAAHLHLFRGRALLALSRLDDAALAAREALRRGDVSGQADLLLSEVMLALGRSQEALESAERARLRMADSPEIWTQYGLANLSVDNLERAHHAFVRALSMDRDWTPAWINRALVERRMGQLSLATVSLEEATRLSPDSGLAWSNYALALRDENRFEEALKAIQRAGRLRPNHAATALNEASILFDGDRVEEAFAAYERALSIAPSLIDAEVGLALVRHRKGLHHRAVEDLQRIVELRPDASIARAALGEMQIWQGDFSPGWDNWEARFSSTDTVVAPSPLPLWNGEALEPGKLLVQSEQGLGDMILFASCFADLLERAPHAVIEAPRKLAGLFCRSFPSAHIYPPSNRVVPEFADRHPLLSCRIPAGSLMRVFRRRRETFPRKVAYLRPDSTRVDRWRARLAGMGSGPYIGISWEGGFNRTGRLSRSIPLAAWRPLIAASPGCIFVSLQYTNRAAVEVQAMNALGMGRLHHFQEAIDDYEETAALVAALDGVMTVCTAIAHLAAAMGVPCLVAAPEVPSWRYHAGGPPPWYSSLRVVRRPPGKGDVAYLRQVAAVAADVFPSWGISPAGSDWAEVNPSIVWDKHSGPIPRGTPLCLPDTTAATKGFTSAEEYLRLAVDHANELAWDAADTAARSALGLDSGLPRAWLIRSRASAARGDRLEAEGFLASAVNRGLVDAEVLEEYSRVLLDQHRHAEAGEAAERALSIEPERAGALSVVGVCRAIGGDVEGAVAAFQRCTELAPGSSSHFLNLANALFELGRFDEAGRIWNWLLAREPQNVSARWNLSRWQLAKRDFSAGWSNYGSRFAAATLAPVSANLPTWMGEPLSGKRVLVIGEQGLGDEIMFASCYQDLLDQGACLVLRCDRRLIGLFSRSFPGADVGPRDDPAAVLNVAADLEVSAGDLPGLLRRTAAAFPVHQGYLRCDPERIDQWRRRLGCERGKRFVGVSWRGGTAVTRAAARSLELASFSVLLTDPSVTLVSVQYGDCMTEIRQFELLHPGRLVHFPEAIHDYSETAALIGALERVVTVCTSIVHLAGALGRPVDVLVPLVPEWRYGLAGEDMLWYPTATLLRQERRGDWNRPLSQVVARLSLGLCGR